MPPAIDPSTTGGPETARWLGGAASTQASGDSGHRGTAAIADADRGVQIAALLDRRVLAEALSTQALVHVVTGDRPTALAAVADGAEDLRFQAVGNPAGHAAGLNCRFPGTVGGVV